MRPSASSDSADLAGIAISSADTVKTLLGWEPRVAMLAFSTDGSAEHESVDVVREAVKLVHEKRPDILCDGEFQLDAAIIPAVAAKKVKRESPVAGKANVLIFPNLHAGNIGVKLIQIFGHANAYGPVLQGFRLPVCDFSRSAPTVIPCSGRTLSVRKSISSLKSFFPRSSGRYIVYLPEE